MQRLAQAQPFGCTSAHWRGRSNLYRLDAHRLQIAQRFLDRMSLRWDSAGDRLKALVEN